MFTNRQIQKLAKEAGLQLGIVDIITKRWAEITGDELDELPMIAQRLAWALLTRIEADEPKPAPEPENTWRIVTPHEASLRPLAGQRLWITYIESGWRAVSSDYRNSTNRMDIHAVAWMPRLPGKMDCERPAPYLGPIPAVEA